MIVVGVPAAIACLAVAFLGYLPTDTELPRSGRLTVAMCLTCFLVYGFTRLPVILMFSLCSVSSAISIAAAISNGDDYGRALIIYLTVANISGCVLGAQIEKRERESFEIELALVEARERLAISAKASSDASAAKSHLMAAVNHDLRQPAASAALYLARVSAEVERCAPGCAPTVEKARECVGAITDNLSRLSAVSDLGDKNRILTAASVDLRAILGRIVGVYSEPANEQEVRFRVELPVIGRFILQTDGARLGDVLANLVSNAIKFSAGVERPWVLVRAVRFGARVRITVRDNGIGMDETHHNQIFDEYFQIENSEGKRNNGYGLGLSIVRDTIARLPSHALILKSVLNKGTRFDLWVPLNTEVYEGGSQSVPGVHKGIGHCTDDRLGEKYDEPPDVTSGDLRGFYVLVVEDDPMVRSALVETLEGWGVLVEAAHSPEAALDLVSAAERFFDLVVSDFGFDNSIDGVELIRKVRSVQCQTTPAIILSGQATSIDWRRLRELGVRAIPKPIYPERLRMELRAHLVAAGCGDVRT